MKTLGINLFKKTAHTRIKSKKEPPKVVSYIHQRPIDTSVSKFTLAVNKLYRGTSKFIENLKSVFNPSRSR